MIYKMYHRVIFVLITVFLIAKTSQTCHIVKKLLYRKQRAGIRSMGQQSTLHIGCNNGRMLLICFSWDLYPQFQIRATLNSARTESAL